jgi:hypothetical protein
MPREEVPIRTPSAKGRLQTTAAYSAEPAVAVASESDSTFATCMSLELWSNGTDQFPGGIASRGSGNGSGKDPCMGNVVLQAVGRVPKVEPQSGLVHHLKCR